MNRKQWLAAVMATREKKAMPILSFPSAKLLGMSVAELISTAENQLTVRVLFGPELGKGPFRRTEKAGHCNITASLATGAKVLQPFFKFIVFHL